MAATRGGLMEESGELLSGAERQVTINATPESVWSLMTDIERFGEWSPETYRVEWQTPPTHGVGSIFRGFNTNPRNAKRWWSDCEVLELDPGRVFKFCVLRADFGDGNVLDLRGEWSTTWRYAIDGGDTDRTARLTLGFDCPAFKEMDSGYRRAGRFEDLESGCDQTLARIKAAAERPWPV
jgi:uncharacterized protein YndB with AHSA1/START domain